MANTINLYYQPRHDKIATEEQMLGLLSDLKNYFGEIVSNFGITAPSGEPIETLQEFLRILDGETPLVTLTGSGKIGPVNINDSCVQYDLAKAKALVAKYKLTTRSQCSNCFVDDRVRRDSYCRMDHSGICTQPEPKIARQDGRQARPFSRLLEEILKA